MKTKYVCRGLVSLYEYFHNNRTMWSTNLRVKICRWGEKEKEPKTGLLKFRFTVLVRPISLQCHSPCKQI